ncbi:MAG: flagellar basal-body rod protein FlgF [Deltaproteobacteria bacterium]
MIKGLYTAAAGMMMQMARQDAIANNLANVNTGGYKRQTAISKEFPQMLISRLGESKYNRQGVLEPVQPKVIGGVGTGACIDAVYTDYQEGRLRSTEQPTDFALADNGVTIGDATFNPGFFVVNTPDGARYTRNGEFKLNSEGYLSTNQGYLVLDTDNQPIQIEGEFTVDKQGRISVNGEEIAQLQVVTFPNPNLLERIGDNLYNSAEQATLIENPQILQGYIEDSNVNAVQEMVTLISCTRAYESLQKMVQAEDELNDVAINQVAATM